EIRIDLDVEQAALVFVLDLWNARDRLRQLAVGVHAQAPRLLADQQPAVRQKRHAPRIVELGQTFDVHGTGLRRDRLDGRSLPRLAVGGSSDHENGCNGSSPPNRLMHDTTLRESDLTTSTTSANGLIDASDMPRIVSVARASFRAASRSAIMRRCASRPSTSTASRRDCRSCSTGWPRPRPTSPVCKSSRRRASAFRRWPCKRRATTRSGTDKRAGTASRFSRRTCNRSKERVY